MVLVRRDRNLTLPLHSLGMSLLRHRYDAEKLLLNSGAQHRVKALIVYSSSFLHCVFQNLGPQMI